MKVVRSELLEVQDSKILKTWVSEHEQKVERSLAREGNVIRLKGVVFVPARARADLALQLAIKIREHDVRLSGTPIHLHRPTLGQLAREEVLLRLGHDDVPPADIISQREPVTVEETAHFSLEGSHPGEGR